MICALEGCNNEVTAKVGVIHHFYYPLDKKAHFCSRRCRTGYLEWCVWQKELGNGNTDAPPPVYGGQLKERVLNEVWG